MKFKDHFAQNEELKRPEISAK